MTTKIKSLAMFAVAAFALVGMAGAPAFAGTIVGVNTQLTSSGSVTTDYDSAYGCVATQGQTLFENSLTVIDGGTDSVTVEYNGAGCPDTDTVKVKIQVDGTWVHDVLHTNAYDIIVVETNIDSGDVVKAYVTFYD